MVNSVSFPKSLYFHFQSAGLPLKVLDTSPSYNVLHHFPYIDLFLKDDTYQNMGTTNHQLLIGKLLSHDFPQNYKGHPPANP